MILKVCDRHADVMDRVLCGRLAAAMLSVLYDFHGGPTLNVLASNAEYHLFVLWSFQTTDYLVLYSY